MVWFVGLLFDKDGDWHHGKGAFYTPTHVCFEGLNHVIQKVCLKKNKDGTYLTEMQIHRCF